MTQYWFITLDAVCLFIEISDASVLRDCFGLQHLCSLLFIFAPTYFKMMLMTALHVCVACVCKPRIKVRFFKLLQC